MPKLSLDLTFSWPRKGDRLLSESNDWNKAAAFSDDPVSRDAYIWSGYMRAGRVLIDACEREPSDRHDLIYPVLFCFRHGLEMAMKWIVGRYWYSVGVTEPKPDHNLWDLWRCCKNVITAITGEADLAAVESLIEQFHKLDKFAIAFRYSSYKKGTLITLPDVPVDMQKLRDVMEGLDHFFQGADGQLDEYTSFAAWETQGLAT